jgi:hypothetical protein
MNEYKLVSRPEIIDLLNLKRNAGWQGYVSRREEITGGWI